MLLLLRFVSVLIDWKLCARALRLLCARLWSLLIDVLNFSSPGRIGKLSFHMLLQ
jgi:hypothetical protein